MNEPRDEALDRLLRQTLRPASSAGSTPSCLDVETMSAWMDGGLSGAALAAAEAHTATCPRCRALAAVIARSESSDLRPAAAIPASEGRRTRNWWPWFVPLAAAALVAIAIWIPRRAPLPTPESTISMAPQVETANQARSLSPLPAPPETPPVQNAQAAAAKEAPGVKPETGRADKAETMPEPPPVPPAPPVESRQTFVAASPPAIPPGPVPPVLPETTAPTPSARALADAQPVARPEPAAGAARAFDSAATDTVIAEFQSPNVAQPPAAAGAPGRAAGVAPGAAAGGRGGGGAGRGGGRAAAPGSIVAQNPPPPQPTLASTQWRVLASGSVQRSNPPGAPWVSVQIDPGARVTNGDASSPPVCWLVGRNGVVFLTENGGSFTRIPFPEAVDLASVRATSAREATVTTTDGRTFETRDGGQSWSRN